MLNGAIDDNKTGDYTVRRTASGPYVNGRPTTGAVTTFVVPASVQPFEGSLSDLEEGQSVENAKTIYTYTPGAQGIIARAPGVAGDVFEIPGDGDFFVQKALKWDHWGETHYVVTAYKLAAL